MPRISLCFQGWINGADIETCVDLKSNVIDVSEMSATELIQKIKAGDLFLSLHDALESAEDSETELHDYEESK